MIINIVQSLTPPALAFAGNVAAAGTTQGTAQPITTRTTVVTSVAAGSGVRLIAPAGPGGERRILNRGSNALLAYPDSGDTFESGEVNAPEAAIEPGGSLLVVWDGTSVWWKP